MSSGSTNWYCIHPETHVREVQNHLMSPTNPTSCGACECPIAGKTFNCSACNSDLHPFCKTGPQCLSSALHPVPGHPLTRLTRDHIMGHAPNRQCAVCCEEIKGVSYTCSPCGFDVHPQCSQLPRVIPDNVGAHDHELELQVTTVVNESCHVCRGQCGRWVYKCNVCSIYVHYLCLLGRASDDGSSYAGPTATTSRGLRGPPYGWPMAGSGSGSGSGSGLIFGVMGKIAGSLAVNLFVEFISNMISSGSFF